MAPVTELFSKNSVFAFWVFGNCDLANGSEDENQHLGKIYSSNSARRAKSGRSCWASGELVPVCSVPACTGTSCSVSTFPAGRWGLSPSYVSPVPFIDYFKLNPFNLRGTRVGGRNVLGCVTHHVLWCPRAPGYVLFKGTWKWLPPLSTPPVTSKRPTNPTRVSLYGCAGKRHLWWYLPSGPLQRSHHPSVATTTTRSRLEKPPSQMRGSPPPGPPWRSHHLNMGTATTRSLPEEPPS